jgi:glycosyltransferase involved in cell wall biosynthesis
VSWPVPGSLAFVCPRYGTEVLGGAETVVREMAERLVARGLDVEVLTTCAADHYTWDNYYAPEPSEVNGVSVRRFEIQKGNRKRHRAIGELIGTGKRVSLAEQEVWLNEGFRSAGLFHYLMDNHSRYHTIVLTPYMFWTTYACSQIAPHKNVLRPCLHDEVFARMEVYQPIFRDVRGMIFNSEPEAELASSLFELPERREVIGEGVEVPSDVDPERFRSAYGIEGEFLLYTGRREWGKNVEVLIEYFGHFLEHSGKELELVLIGRGKLDIPRELRGRVRDLGFVSERDKHDAFAAATVVCQPSKWESFSRLLMEGWLGATPALAYGGCAVTAHHVETSEGGLVYNDLPSFEAALNILLEHPELRRTMGEAGRSYVQSRYRWDDVLDRLVDRISVWAEQDLAANPARGPEA